MSKIIEPYKKSVHNKDSEYNINEIFSHVPMFADFANHEGVGMLTEKSKIITVPQDKILVKEGELGDDAFVMLSGKIEVLKKSLSGDNYVVATISVDENSLELPLIGEQSLVTKGERTATIKTLTEVVLLELYHSAFLKISEKYPEIGIQIYRNLCFILQNRLKISNNNVVSLFQEYLEFMTEDLLEGE